MRVTLSEISAGRVAEAVKRRLAATPTAAAWRVGRESASAKNYLKSFGDRHAGERCFILANGPSVADVPMGMLRSERTFSMNRAYLMYDSWGFTPSYFVAVNDLVLEQFADDISSLSMPKFVTWAHRGLFRDADDVGLVHTRSCLLDRFREHPLDGLCTGGTVTYVTLQLAFYMGFKEVVLVGLDHRFSAQGRPNKTETRTEVADSDHMHPEYFPQGSKWQLPDLTRSEVAYRRARVAFEGAGRRIVDATIDGACTVFEKASLDAL